MKVSTLSLVAAALLGLEDRRVLVSGLAQCRFVDDGKCPIQRAQFAVGTDLLFDLAVSFSAIESRRLREREPCGEEPQSSE